MVAIIITYLKSPWIATKLPGKIPMMLEFPVKAVYNHSSFSL